MGNYSLDGGFQKWNEAFEFQWSLLHCHPRDTFNPVKAVPCTKGPKMFAKSVG